MSIDPDVLCKRAEKLELKESKKIVHVSSFRLALENLLLDVYTVLRPKPIDYEHRRILIRTFNVIAKEIFGCKNGFPVVEPFGSFTMDMFTCNGDLDLSVNFSDKEGECSREKKISSLREIAKVLYVRQRKGDCSGVLPILSARVPVLKVVDCGTRIECDLSVDNKDGITRSIFLAIVASIDERFRILSYLVKCWAKAHEINSSKDGTMSSLTLISLVAFHLQTRDPPILPPFSALLKDGIDVAKIQTNVFEYEGFGRRNKESVAELFVTLFLKLVSVESLWKEGLCASVYRGSWISKNWNTKKRLSCIKVEDFLDRSENCARAVTAVQMQTICTCLRSSLAHLSDSLKGKLEVSEFRSLMFGASFAYHPHQEIVHKRSHFHGVSPPSHEFIPSKRPRYSEHKEMLHLPSQYYPQNLSLDPYPLGVPQKHLHLPFSPQFLHTEFTTPVFRNFESHNPHRNDELRHHIPLESLRHVHRDEFRKFELQHPHRDGELRHHIPLESLRHVDHDEFRNFELRYPHRDDDRKHHRPLEPLRHSSSIGAFEISSSRRRFDTS